MSNLSLRKGNGFEREVEKIVLASGLDCIKTGAFKEHDLIVNLDGIDRIWECKRRKRGFARLYEFLKKAWAVIHRDDYQEPLITLRLADFLNLVKK